MNWKWVVGIGAGVVGAALIADALIPDEKEKAKEAEKSNKHNYIDFDEYEYEDEDEEEEASENFLDRIKRNRENNQRLMDAMKKGEI